MTDLPLTLTDVLGDTGTRAGVAKAETSVPDWWAEPTFDEAHAEWLRFYRIPAEDLDPTGDHAGQYVAALGATIRGYDADPVALRSRVASSLNVHPERLVISFLDG